MGVIGIPNIEVIRIGSVSEWSDRTLQLRHDTYLSVTTTLLQTAADSRSAFPTGVDVSPLSCWKQATHPYAARMLVLPKTYLQIYHTHNFIAKTKIAWSFSEFFLCPYVNQHESHLARAETVRVSCYRFDTCDIGINFIGDPEMVFPLCHQGIPLGCDMTTLLGTSIRSSVASLSGWLIC